jgi:hypothetical protein
MTAPVETPFAEQDADSAGRLRGLIDRRSEKTAPLLELLRKLCAEAGVAASRQGRMPEAKEIDRLLRELERGSAEPSALHAVKPAAPTIAVVGATTPRSLGQLPADLRGRLPSRQLMLLFMQQPEALGKMPGYRRVLAELVEWAAGLDAPAAAKHYPANPDASAHRSQVGEGGRRAMAAE